MDDIAYAVAERGDDPFGAARSPDLEGMSTAAGSRRKSLPVASSAEEKWP